MKENIYILVFGLMLLSCETVVFETPVPSDRDPLDAVPEAFHGVFSFPGGSAAYDTIAIGPNYLEADRGRWYISDSMVVKKLDDDVVFNLKFRDKPELGDHWLPVIVSRPRDGDLRTIQFGSGVKQEDIDNGTASKIVRAYGAKLISKKGADVTVFLARADSETLRAMRADEEIAVEMRGKRIQD